MNKIIIPLPLASMNEYSNAQRAHKAKGARMKKTNTHFCKMYVLKAMREGFELSTPCKLKFTWIVPNKRKDADNIASAKKFILDGMQDAKLIENDNLNHITGFVDEFIVDKTALSVVEITELEE